MKISKQADSYPLFKVADVNIGGEIYSEEEYKREYDKGWSRSSAPNRKRLDDYEMSGVANNAWLDGWEDYINGDPKYTSAQDRGFNL